MEDKCNYIEYVLYNSISDDGKEVDIDVSDVRYQQLMYKLARTPYKYFGKFCKRYQHHDLICENHEHEEIKVYSKLAIKHEVDKENGLIKLYYAKDKVPYHMFPSTTKMNAVSHVRKLVFRVHNRVYINFQLEQQVGTQEIRRKVYINYNLDKNVDTGYMEDLISKAIKEFLE